MKVRQEIALEIFFHTKKKDLKLIEKCGYTASFCGTHRCGRQIGGRYRCGAKSFHRKLAHAGGESNLIEIAKA